MFASTPDMLGISSKLLHRHQQHQQKQQQLLHFLASIPEDKRRLVRLGDEAKVSIRELQEFHEKRKQSSIVEYLSAIETEVNDVLL